MERFTEYTLETLETLHDDGLTTNNPDNNAPILREVDRDYRVQKVHYTHPFEAQLQPTDSQNEEVKVLKDEKHLNRALFGDIVRLDSQQEQVCGILNEYNPRIVGILQARSVVTYGTNKRGIPLYLVRTLNHNYPNFLVPYDKRKKGTNNQYVLIRRHVWSSTNKRPIGKIDTYLGLVGDPRTEIYAILSRFDLPLRPISRNAIRQDPDCATAANDLNEERVDLRDRYVFSIDPPGCEDIDDAMHICDQDNGSYEIGIHIADPSLYLKPGSIQDTLARDRASSIYAPEPVGRIDMLFPKLSTEKASLLEKEDRHTNTVLFRVSDQGEISDVQFMNSLIHNRQNLNYDEADAAEAGAVGVGEVHDFAGAIRDLKRITCKLAKRYLPRLVNEEATSIDSHKLVEIWMILTNHEVGKELVRRFRGQAPIRTFHLPENNSSKEPGRKECQSKNPDHLSPALLDQIRLKEYSAAKYTLYQEWSIKSGLNTKNPNAHEALGISDYTHFTSPIRRYFDLMVHRVLFHKIPDENICSLLQHINSKNQNIKRAERRFNRLRIVEELRSRGSGEDLEERMVLVDWTDTSLELWSEHWRCILRYRLIPRLLEKRFRLDRSGALILQGQEQGLEQGLEQGQDPKNKVPLHTFRHWDIITVRCVPVASAESLWQKVQFELLHPQIDLV